MKISNFLACQIGLLIAQLVIGHFKDIKELAEALESLSGRAWLEAYEFPPPSNRID